MLPLVVIVRYWLVQGALYMNGVERLHRWSLELVVFLLIIASGLVGIDSRGLIISFLVAHSASMLFNGHLFAMLTHDLFWYAAYRDKQRFISYVDLMASRLQRRSPGYVSAVVFYGSLTRGVFRDSSDLDVRYVAREGIINALLTAHLVFIDRFQALWARFPIDAYMFRDRAEVETKMDVVNETPVVLYLGDGGDKLAENLEPYQEFRKRFVNVETTDS